MSSNSSSNNNSSRNNETWITLAEARKRSYGQVNWWKCQGLQGELVEECQHRPGAPEDRPVLLYSCGDMYLGGWHGKEYSGFGVFYFQDGYVIAGHCKGSNIKSIKCLWLPSAPCWRQNRRAESVIQLPRKRRVHTDKKEKDAGLPFLYFGSIGGDWFNDPRATVILKSGTTRVGPWKLFSPVGNWWRDHEKHITSRAEVKRLTSYAQKFGSRDKHVEEPAVESAHSRESLSVGDIVWKPSADKDKQASQSTMTTLQTSACSNDTEFDRSWTAGVIDESSTGETYECTSLHVRQPISETPPSSPIIKTTTDKPLPSSGEASGQVKSPKSVSFVDGTKPASPSTASPGSASKKLADYFEELSCEEAGLLELSEASESIQSHLDDASDSSSFLRPMLTAYPAPTRATPSTNTVSPERHTWQYDEDFRNKQLALLTEWLSRKIIRYHADVVEMRAYAQHLVDCGFHSPQMIEDLCTPDDVASFTFMKPVHKRLLLQHADLKLTMNIPLE